MDGVIPAFNADSKRWLTARFGLSSGTSSAQALQSGLFEQLLSAPPRIERQSSASNASYASPSVDPMADRDSYRGETSATRRSDSDERQDVQPDDEEQSEQSTVAVQANALPMPPVATPQPVDEDTPAVIPEGAAAGDAAADSNSSDADTNQSTLGELPTEQPSIVSDQAKGRPQDAVDNGAAEASSLVGTAQVQAVAADKTSGSESSTDKAAGESVTQVQTAQKVAVPATEDAATGAPALDISGAAPMEEQSSQELGDEPLAHPRSQVSGKENVAATGDRSQVSGQAEAASTGGSKSRDNRREKWFQRDAGDAGSAGRESNAASDTPAAQAGIAAGKLSAGIASAQGGVMGAAMGEVAVNNSTPAAENIAAQMLPDSVPHIQPPAMSAAAMATDGRLSALENAASDGSGGERQLARGNAVEGVDTSQRQTSAQRAEAKPSVSDAQRADVLTQAERVRLVQRVSRSFARLGPMGGQISLKLHPPQLGALNVQVRMEGRSMAAKLTTESGAARDAILESLPVLRKRLAEQGFDISSFQVEVADNQSDVTSGSDNSRAGSDQAGDRDNRQAAGQGTDYRRLAAQQRQDSQRYEVLPSSVASSGAAWELPRGVDVEA